MEDPKISIIIPTYNRAHLIGETLESIISQTFKNWECIVVDDGSNDYTLELLSFYIQKDNRIKFFSRPHELPKGPNACRNYGYELSIGKFINWIDSDDILLSSALEKKVLAIGENDVVISTLKYIDENGEILRNIHQYKSDNLIRDYLVGKITFYTFTPLWSKKYLIKQPKLFDNRLSNLDDWDFNLRMLYNKPKMVFIDEALILYRVHTNSLSQEIYKMNFQEIKSEVRARKKHLFFGLKKNPLKGAEYKKFILKRNKAFLREALINNASVKYYLYLNLILIQLVTFKFKGIMNSTLALLGYSLFGKGYRFLR